MIYGIFIILLIISIVINIFLARKLAEKVIFTYQEHQKQEEYYNSKIEKAKLKLEEIEIQRQTNADLLSKERFELDKIAALIPEKTQQLSVIREGINMAKENYEREVAIAKEEIDKDFQGHCEELQEAIAHVIRTYQTKEAKLVKELQGYEDKISAYIESQKREMEKKDNLEFYKLSLDEFELSDVNRLLELAHSLNQPDVLRKLVYKTYFEKKMNDLLGRVVGVNSNVSGVYKITHIDTGLCYIGQATDIKERWRKHLKCGLGIDTPVTNSFYQGMIKYKPWNFTWEIMSLCPKEKLNEEEKYWIDFYQTKTWGWNSKGGNK